MIGRLVCIKNTYNPTATGFSVKSNNVGPYKLAKNNSIGIITGIADSYRPTAFRVYLPIVNGSGVFVLNEEIYLL